jgi:hypothetical protein
MCDKLHWYWRNTEKTTLTSTQTAPFRLLAVSSPTYWDRAYRFKDQVLWDEIRRKQGNVSAFSGFMLGQCRFLIRCFSVYLWFFKINQIFV